MIKIILLSVFLSGCSLVQWIPSTTACDEVDYNRKGSQVVIKAKCEV